MTKSEEIKQSKRWALKNLGIPDEPLNNEIIREMDSIISQLEKDKTLFYFLNILKKIDNTTLSEKGLEEVKNIIRDKKGYEEIKQIIAQIDIILSKIIYFDNSSLIECLDRCLPYLNNELHLKLSCFLYDYILNEDQRADRAEEMNQLINEAFSEFSKKSNETLFDKLFKLAKKSDDISLKILICTQYCNYLECTTYESKMDLIGVIARNNVDSIFRRISSKLDDEEYNTILQIINHKTKDSLLDGTTLRIADYLFDYINASTDQEKKKILIALEVI